MNKFKKLLESTSLTTLIVAGVLLAGIVSAGTVTYLSNSVQVDPDVESPVELSHKGKRWNNDDWGWKTDRIDLNISYGDSNGNLYGGSSYYVPLKRVNRANQDIEGYFNTVITPDPDWKKHAIEEGDFDLTLVQKDGSGGWEEIDWPNINSGPCEESFSDNKGHYNWRIGNIPAGETRGDLGLKIHFRQSIDPEPNYILETTVLDPVTKEADYTNVGNCPWN